MWCRRTLPLACLVPVLVMLFSLPWERLCRFEVTRSALFAPIDVFLRNHPLAAATIKESTHNDYMRSLLVFHDAIGAQPSTFEELDVSFEGFANDLFEDTGKGKQLIINAMCGIVNRVPSSAAHFACVRRALKGRGRKSTPKQALPLTRQLALRFIRYFLSRVDADVGF